VRDFLVVLFGAMLSFFMGALFGWILFGISTQSSPVPHDICTLSLGPEPKCVVMSFDGRQRIEDGQVWAYEPDGSVQYMSDVWLVRKCLENCEIGGSF